MNITNMSKRAFSLSLLMLVMLAFTVSSSSAADSDVSDVSRTLPDSVNPNTEFTVVLDIDGSTPLVIGIVENIPQGLSFPSDDADISSSCDFTVDRDNMTIAFSAIDVDTISYNLVSSSEGIYDFTGQWVDLLYQNVEVDVLADRLETVSGDSVFNVAVSSSTDSGSSSGSSSSSGSNTGTSLLSIPVEEDENTEVVTVDMNAASEEEEEALKSTDDSGNDEGVEDETASSAEESAERNAEVESSVNSAPGFSTVLSCLAFVLALAVVGRRKW